MKQTTEFCISFNWLPDEVRRKIAWERSCPNEAKAAINLFDVYDSLVKSILVELRVFSWQLVPSTT